MRQRPAGGIVRRVFRVVLIGAAACLLLKITTVGWGRATRMAVRLVPQDTSLVTRLTAHVRHLAEAIGDRNSDRYDQLQQAAAYITAQLAEAGYTVEYQPYAIGGQPFRNIVATKRGARSPEDVIVVGAHYDSCWNPGADDNASGVAALLELARMLAARSLDRTVVFAAFVNEEPPHFQTPRMGSWHYVQAARAAGTRMVAMLSLEMLGYYTTQPYSQRYPPLLGLGRPNRGDFIAVVGNVASRSLVRQVTAAFRHHSRFPIESIAAPTWVPGVAWSDQWAFWQAGLPAVMVTDTAHLRNPHYHQPTDTWDTLQYDAMACVVEGLAGVIGDVAAASAR